MPNARKGYGSGGAETLGKSGASYNRTEISGLQTTQLMQFTASLHAQGNNCSTLQTADGLPALSVKKQNRFPAKFSAANSSVGEGDPRI